MADNFKIQKPFLKWVGGKTQLLDKIKDKFPSEINNYHEIFLGGGSILFALLSMQKTHKLVVKGRICAYDINESLINVYKHVQTNKDELYDLIEAYVEEYDMIEGNEINRTPKNEQEATTSKESYYYWIRNKYNNIDKNTIECSALFMFINKTCFRGMYREGPNGYNIPYGNYKNPKIIDKKELDFISELIADVNFIHCDFSKGFEHINDNNFVYLDPPYAPENDKSFVGYTKDGFDIKQHELLFDLTKKISEKNMIMMSNANVKLVRDNLLPDNFKYDVVSCRRAINSKNPSAKTEEVIITNY